MWAVEEIGRREKFSAIRLPAQDRRTAAVGARLSSASASILLRYIE
jgi:hypothetical protein